MHLSNLRHDNSLRAALTISMHRRYSINPALVDPSKPYRNMSASEWESATSKALEPTDTLVVPEMAMIPVSSIDVLESRGGLVVK